MAASISSTALSLSSLYVSSPSSSTPLSRSSHTIPQKSSPLCSLRSIFSESVKSSRFRPHVASDAVFPEEEDEESPEEVRRAYEELFGPAFSRLSLKKTADDEGIGSKRVARDRNAKDNMEEKVVQVRRVTKVVKGGKQLSFRAIVVVGDKQGRVGVGVGKAKEVIIAVQKASTDARRHLINVPMTKQKTFPHRADGKYGAAKVMLRPAAPGTGVIAGGSVRTVLELAGVVNAMGKELGSKNPLNNARAVVEAISGMKQFRDVAEKRGIPMEVLWQ